MCFNLYGGNKETEKVLDMEEENIGEEIAELFAGYGDEESIADYKLEDFSFEELGSVSYYTLNYDNESLADVFLNWYDAWATKTAKEKNINSFLADENLTKFLDEQAFMDIVSGQAFVSEDFLYIVRQKLPFMVKEQKLFRLNEKLEISNKAYCVEMRASDIRQTIELLKQQEKEQKLLAKRKMNAQYRERHYDETHKTKTFDEKLDEKIRKLRRELKGKPAPEITKKLYYFEKQAKKKHQQYLENKELFAERCRIWRKNNAERLKQIVKDYRQTHKKEIAKIKKRYYMRHRTELLEKAKEWREENPDRVKATSHANYMKNREKRREQNREWIKNNPEKRKAQKAKEYAAHAEEIKAKQAERRKKLRWKNKTGAKIMSLLQGIIRSKSETTGR